MNSDYMDVGMMSEQREWKDIRGKFPYTYTLCNNFIRIIRVRERERELLIPDYYVWDDEAKKRAAIF